VVGSSAFSFVVTGVIGADLFIENLFVDRIVRGRGGKIGMPVERVIIMTRSTGVCVKVVRYVTI
jgi:hypothetical protein